MSHQITPNHIASSASKTKISIRFSEDEFFQLGTALGSSWKNAQFDGMKDKRQETTLPHGSINDIYAKKMATTFATLTLSARTYSF